MSANVSRQTLRDADPWHPEILSIDERGTLVWIAAPFAMSRISSALLGRTLLIDGLQHCVEAVMVDGLASDRRIREGERIGLPVRPSDPIGPD